MGLNPYKESLTTTSVCTSTETSLSSSKSACSNVEEMFFEATIDFLEPCQIETETTNLRPMVDAIMQFSLDAAQQIFHELSY